MRLCMYPEVRSKGIITVNNTTSYLFKSEKQNIYMSIQLEATLLHYENLSKNIFCGQSIKQSKSNCGKQFSKC